MSLQHFRAFCDVDEGGFLDTTGVLTNDYDEDLPGDLLAAEKDPTSTFRYGNGNIFADGRLEYTHNGTENFLDSIMYYVAIIINDR